MQSTAKISQAEKSTREIVEKTSMFLIFCLTEMCSRWRLALRGELCGAA